MMTPFGPWEPDNDATDAQVMTTAENVFPIKTGWGPMPSLSVIGATGLSERGQGLFFARTTSGAFQIFAGSKTKLYKYNASTGVFDDYTRTVGGAYNCPTDEFWSFTQFGSHVIACNFNDDVQQIDIDTGATNFAALAGSPPKARYVGVVGDFVFLAALASQDRTVRNSAFNDSTGWTVGTALCDDQTFQDGGRITGFVGGEFGYVVQDHAIRRCILQPAFDQAFRFERIEQERGSVAGYGLSSSAGTMYFYANDGFYAYNSSSGLTPIGAQRVNQWFREHSDPGRYLSIQAFADPFGPRVFWAFFSDENQTYFDRLITYDWQLDRWAYGKVTAQCWGPAITAGVTLESLNSYGSIDTGVPASLDSRIWEGGLPFIGGIDNNGKLTSLEGAPLDALLLTAPAHLADGNRANVTRVYPHGIFGGAVVKARVGHRETGNQIATYTGTLTPSTSGQIWARAGGRIHEFELSVFQGTASPNWRHAEGLVIDAIPAGIT